MKSIKNLFFTLFLLAAGVTISVQAAQQAESSDRELKHKNAAGTVAQPQGQAAPTLEQRREIASQKQRALKYERLKQSSKVLKVMLTKYERVPVSIKTADAIKLKIEQEIPQDLRTLEEYRFLAVFYAEKNESIDVDLVQQVEKAIEKYAQGLIERYNKTNHSKGKPSLLMMPRPCAKPLPIHAIDAAKMKKDASDIVNKYYKAMNFKSLAYEDFCAARSQNYEPSFEIDFHTLKKILIESSNNAELLQFMRKQFFIMQDLYYANHMMYCQKRVKAIREYYESAEMALCKDKNLSFVSQDEEQYYARIRAELVGMQNLKEHLAFSPLKEQQKLSAQIVALLPQMDEIYGKMMECSTSARRYVAAEEACEKEATPANKNKLLGVLQESLALAQKYRNKHLGTIFQQKIKILQEELAKQGHEVVTAQPAQVHVDKPGKQGVVPPVLTLPPVNDAAPKIPTTPTPNKGTLTIAQMLQVSATKDTTKSTPPPSGKRVLPAIQQAGASLTVPAKSKKGNSEKPKAASKQKSTVKKQGKTGS